MSDFFQVFALERRLGIDVAALQRRFYELSRQWHPDFHQAAAPAEQARALEESARVNAAYRALRDPIARVEYLIRLEAVRAEAARSPGRRGDGRETQEGAAVKPKAPPELLAEMFEIQEALEAVRAEAVRRGEPEIEDAKAGSLDDATRASLAAQRQALAARRADIEARIVGPLSRAWDAAAPGARPAALAALREALATRAYLRTVIDDLGTALGEGDEETHVAHRRD
jgi:molecular chaperone HscB